MKTVKWHISSSNHVCVWERKTDRDRDREGERSHFSKRYQFSKVLPITSLICFSDSPERGTRERLFIIVLDRPSGVSWSKANCLAKTQNETGNINGTADSQVSSLNHGLGMQFKSEEKYTKLLHFQNSFSTFLFLSNIIKFSAYLTAGKMKAPI